MRKSKYKNQLVIKRMEKFVVKYNLIQQARPQKQIAKVSLGINHFLELAQAYREGEDWVHIFWSKVSFLLK